MEGKKLVPYSVYIPMEQHEQLKQLAKNRKAAALVRDAINIILNGNDQYKSGYNNAIEDASQVVYSCKEAQMVAVNGRDVGALLSDQIKELAIK
jgi:predicted DNA-binding protein